MKSFIVSLSNDILTTIITFLIIVSVFIGNNNNNTNTHHLIVNAQEELFVNCRESLLNAPYTNTCRHNVPTPLTYELPNGQKVSFGDESYLIAACIPSLERSIDTCICQVFVDPGDFIAPFDLCNSCTIKDISNTTLIASFDCSNRLDGDCVGIDADGECIDNSGADNGGVVPTPTPFSTSQPISPTIIIPTAPTSSPNTPYPNSVTIPSPTLQPSMTTNQNSTTIPISNMTNDEDLNTPINTNVSTNNERSRSTNALIIGVAIGCAGCLVLAVLIALLILIIRRKHAKSTFIETNKDVTFNNPYNTTNVNPDEMIRPRSYRATHGNTDTSAIASLIQPITATIPLQSYPPITTNTLSNHHPYPIAAVEPKKSTTTTTTTSPTPPLPSYPLNPHLHVKDQCRDVGMTPIVATAATAPTTVVPTMAFAVPVNVNQ